MVSFVHQNILEMKFAIIGLLGLGTVIISIRLVMYLA